MELICRLYVFYNPELICANVKQVVEALLESGVHLDTVNSDGKVFESLLKTQPLHEVVKNPLKFTNLQCLASRVIKKEGVPYKGLLAPALEHFVELH